MAYLKKLGIFVKDPQEGDIKTRLVPPLSEGDACELYRAFLEDLFKRVQKLKKCSVTAFYSGASADPVREMLPKGWSLTPQRGNTPGERLQHAFEALLAEEGNYAVIIGSDSPDIPLLAIKRAYNKLKHKDVVLGPSADGGYYLIGLKQQFPALFEDVPWGEDSALRRALEIVASRNMNLSLLPLWYNVDTPQSLELLETMMLGKRIERSGRLHRTERVLLKLQPDNDSTSER
jgi:rSAM/selenodomain-associated transferase 1